MDGSITGQHEYHRHLMAAVLPALLAGCLGFEGGGGGGGCPSPISGPTYPSEPTKSYRTIEIDELRTPEGDVWVRTRPAFRDSLLTHLRDSRMFSDIRNVAAPSPGQPALMLTGGIADAYLTGRFAGLTGTPYIAGRFELRDDAGNTLATFIEISCGTRGQNAFEDHEIRELLGHLGEKVADFIIDYSRGNRPTT
jgi:hypothetical protein